MMGKLLKMQVSLHSPRVTTFVTPAGLFLSVPHSTVPRNQRDWGGSIFHSLHPSSDNLVTISDDRSTGRSTGNLLQNFSASSYLSEVASEYLPRSWGVPRAGAHGGGESSGGLDSLVLVLPKSRFKKECIQDVADGSLRQGYRKFLPSCTREAFL